MSAVAVVLDTRAPLLTYEADEAVMVPPAPWEVAISANEAIGDARFDFYDGAGRAHNVGYAFVSPTLLLVQVPTGEFSGGDAVLRGWVGDEVNNRAVVNFAVKVRRAAAYGVTMEIAHAYGASLGLEQAYEASMSTGLRLR